MLFWEMLCSVWLEQNSTAFTNEDVIAHETHSIAISLFPAQGRSQSSLPVITFRHFADFLSDKRLKVRNFLFYSMGAIWESNILRFSVQNVQKHFIVI